MLTGVETAGLVLAALPLVISALEHYKEGFRPLKTLFWDWRFELDNLIRCLRAQKVHFAGNLYRLIKAAAAGEDAGKLSEDFGRALWHGQVGGNVKRYLAIPDAFKAFEETVEEYESCVKKIVRKLGNIQRPATAASKHDLAAILAANPPQKGEYALKERFRFTMKKEEMQSLVRDLDSANLTLTRFLNDHDSINSARDRDAFKTTDAKKLVSTFDSVQRHANSLTAALLLGWVSGCHPSHQVLMHLDCRGALPDPHPRSPNLDDVKFKLSFAREPAASPSWHETTIMTTEVEQGAACLTSSMSQLTVAVPNVIVSPPSPLLGSQQPIGRTEINDICATVGRAWQQKRALILVLSSERRLLCTEFAYCPTIEAKFFSKSTMSLDDFLKRLPLLPSQRIYLALKIASSILQFNSTQWMSHSWDKFKIHFFLNDTQSPPIVDVDNPLIRETFTHSDTQASPIANSPKAVFLEFGILLQEIWHRQSLETWAAASSVDLDDSYWGRMLAALKWFEANGDELPAKYGEVAQRCIKFSFEEFQPRWDDAELRQALCGRIICPLREDCKIFPRPVSNIA